MIYVIGVNDGGVLLMVAVKNVIILIVVVDNAALIARLHVH